MSRSEENKIANTGTNAASTYYNNSQNSYTNAQNDVNDYESQLANYKAANPYGEGGQFQTDTNKVLANTADAKARSAGNMLQGAALRTGQNTAGDVAATENMTQQAARDVSGQEAEAQQERIGAGAGYGKSVLAATEAPATMEASLAGQQGSDATGMLGVAQKAGDQPNWADEFGEAMGKSFGSGAGAAASSLAFGG
jgi:hypothetical protein